MCWPVACLITPIETKRVLTGGPCWYSNVGFGFGRVALVGTPTWGLDWLTPFDFNIIFSAINNRLPHLGVPRWATRRYCLGVHRRSRVAGRRVQHQCGNSQAKGATSGGASLGSTQRDVGNRGNRLDDTIGDGVRMVD